MYQPEGDMATATMADMTATTNPAVSGKGGSSSMGQRETTGTMPQQPQSQKGGTGAPVGQQQPVPQTSQVPYQLRNIVSPSPSPIGMGAPANPNPYLGSMNYNNQYSPNYGKSLYDSQPLGNTTYGNTQFGMPQQLPNPTGPTPNIDTTMGMDTTTSQNLSNTWDNMNQNLADGTTTGGKGGHGDPIVDPLPPDEFRYDKPIVDPLPDERSRYGDPIVDPLYPGDGTTTGGKGGHGDPIVDPLPPDEFRYDPNSVGTTPYGSTDPSGLTPSIYVPENPYGSSSGTDTANISGIYPTDYGTNLGAPTSYDTN